MYKENIPVNMYVIYMVKYQCFTLVHDALHLTLSTGLLGAISAEIVDQGQMIENNYLILYEAN